MCDYYCYKFQIRPEIFNPILYGKCLFQQFVVDTYTSKLRVLDWITYAIIKQRLGLTSTKDWLIVCMLVREDPKWDEITRELYPRQAPQDCPDLVDRVLRAKLEELKHMCLKKDILRKVRAHVYVVESQSSMTFLS
jgi:hypothetical protein